MVIGPLASYLIRRYLVYVVAASCTFSIIINIIEACEKLAKSEGAPAHTVLYYTLIRTIPLLLQLIPLASFIASMCIIRELLTKGEFETFFLLSISPNKFALLLGIGSSTLAVTSWSLQEFIVNDLALYAEHFKRTTLKKIDSGICIKALSNHEFSISIHDNVFEFDVSDDFSHIHRHEKKLAPHNAALEQHADQANLCAESSKIWEIITHAEQIPSHYHRKKKQLYLEACTRIHKNLMITLNAICPAYLFFLLFYQPTFRWIAMFLYYPMITALFSSSTMMALKYQVYFFFIPYSFITFFILFAIMKFKKDLFMLKN